MPGDALDPETEWRLVRSDTPVDVAGFKFGEPTGEVICEEGGESAMNIDEIPHDADCPQRWSRTEFWADRFSGI